MPSVVLLSDRVGAGFTLQHTPFAVIAEPPSLVIFPPELAIFEDIPVMAFVVRTGAVFASVVKLYSLPYTVPASLIANARM